MPPPASTPTPNKDISSLVALVVCLPLVAVSLLVLRAVVVYRRRTRSHGALSVGVTVDVSKVFDSPLKVSRSKTTRSRNTSSQTFHLDLSEFGILERTRPRPFQDSPRTSTSPPVTHHHRFSQRPLYDVRYSHLSALPTSGTTPPLSLAVAFPSIDVDALTQSTVKFPRLPSLHDPKSVAPEYPTIPSLRTVSSHRVSTSDILAESYSRTQPDRISSQSRDSLSEPFRDPSLDTLVDSGTWPTIDSRKGSTLDLGDSSSPQEFDRRPSSCSASVHSHFEALTDSGSRARQSGSLSLWLDACSAHTRPTSAARNACSFSPLVATSLSPLRAPSITDSPELSPSPKLDDFLKTRSLLIDEILPDVECTVSSPASFRPLSILASKPSRGRFPGKVLQPLFETMGTGLRDRTDLSHYSVSSLRSAFSLSGQSCKALTSPARNLPACHITSSSLSIVFDNLLDHSCDISSLRTICESPRHPSSPTISFSPRTTHSPASSQYTPFESYASLDHLAVLSPAISFKLSFSPSSPALSTHSFDASPYARPHAPTPGSVASRFSSTMDRSVDITDMDFEVVDNCVFKMQHAPVSPCFLDAPSRDGMSEAEFLDVAASAPKLLPPFDFQNDSPLSL
ncbi:hypothetical protein PHLGIDRAFT_185352 [Phlebiopsis gigantea 11061_1 CR5-6]|uniref:Uncharacterized protein n=1 Tax=Phlebiopsis gigantea (strain 11061_1 CR5-6) TaxID=745531 RepID=A0A0C3S4W6_PHLG1|nr:hypothetical protein PHLGIDRAFT_185352 [Phlebiopsis gigantea 11061_1 CR5-6]